MPAPIVLFVYNRPKHTLQTLTALKENALANESLLYIYADGPSVNASAVELEKIKEVRDILRREKWCGEVRIIERATNSGLADSIVGGVTDIINNHGCVIVLEDDIVTSPGFLKFMNDALSFYKDEDKVMHICAYFWPTLHVMQKTLFVQNAGAWGWGTWKRAWQHFEPDAAELHRRLKESGKLEDFKALMWGEPYLQLMQNINQQKKTWAVKWNTLIYLKQGLCLLPGKSLVNNIGNDGSGTNKDLTDFYYCKELAANIPVEKIALANTEIALEDLRYKPAPRPAPGIMDRIKGKIKHLIKQIINIIS
jgi:hypothetical protein